MTMMVPILVGHLGAKQQYWFVRDLLAACVGPMLARQRIPAPAHIAVAALELVLLHRQQHAWLGCKSSDRIQFIETMIWRCAANLKLYTTDLHTLALFGIPVDTKTSIGVGIRYEYLCTGGQRFECHRFDKDYPRKRR